MTSTKRELHQALMEAVFVTETMIYLNASLQPETVKQLIAYAKKWRAVLEKGALPDEPQHS